jgi:hypothetical protein
MFKTSLKYMYIHSVFMLHVSATQGHLQATHFKESTALCTLSNSTLKVHRYYY